MAMNQYVPEQPVVFILQWLLFSRLKYFFLMQNAWSPHLMGLTRYMHVCSDKKTLKRWFFIDKRVG